MELKEKKKDEITAGVKVNSWEEDQTQNEAYLVWKIIPCNGDREEIFFFHLFFYKEQTGNIFQYYEADKVHEAKPRHSGAVQTIH